MASIDIIILIVIGGGTVVGFMKGFLRQLASLIGLIAGLLAARALYASLAQKLYPVITESMTVANIISFIIIWVAVPLGFMFVAKLLTSAMEAVKLGWLNRWLGAALGALKYMLLIGLFINVIKIVDPENKLISETKQQESVLYHPMEALAGIFFPVIKNIVQKYIN